MFWPFGLSYRRQVQTAGEVSVIRQALGDLRIMVAHSFQELKQMIEQSTTVQRSAIELIKNLAERLEEIAQHPSAEEVRKLAQDIRQHAEELAGAIAMHAKDDEEEGEAGVEPEEPDEKE
jgi:hypothetical protein